MKKTKIQKLNIVYFSVTICRKNVTNIVSSGQYGEHITNLIIVRARVAKWE